MILVVASAVDKVAAGFVEELSLLTPAAVMTCKNIALECCDIHCPNLLASSLTIDSQKVWLSEVRGVLCLLPTVIPDELYFYPDDEREYQSMEFLALLTYVFANLPCPVINRPTACSLSGPFASQTAWYHLAQQLHISVAARNWLSDEISPETEKRSKQETIESTILNGQSIFNHDSKADKLARSLAISADIQYLHASFLSGNPYRLNQVKTTPNLREPQVRSALIEALVQGGAS